MLLHFIGLITNAKEYYDRYVFLTKRLARTVQVEYF